MSTLDFTRDIDLERLMAENAMHKAGKEKAEAACAQAMKLLAASEFVVCPPREHDQPISFCPFCGSTRKLNGEQLHEMGCRLAALFEQPNPGQALLDELAYLRKHHDDCHQPAANYQLLLDKLNGTPTNHGDCPVAAALDSKDSERDEARAACAAMKQFIDDKGDDYEYSEQGPDLMRCRWCGNAIPLKTGLPVARIVHAPNCPIIDRNPGQPLLDRLARLEAFLRQVVEDFDLPDAEYSQLERRSIAAARRLLEEGP